MWIKAIAGVVTELHRSGRMAGFGGVVGGVVVLGGFGIVWHRSADLGAGLAKGTNATSHCSRKVQ